MSTSVFVRHWQSLSGNSCNRLLSASTCWYPQKCLGLVIVYEMDPKVGQSLDGHSFSLCSTLCLCNPSMGILFPLLRRIEVSTLAFLLTEFHVVCELYRGYSKLLGYYPLINECISCVFFCDWVTSLRMISSRSNHLPKNFMNSLFLIAE